MSEKPIQIVDSTTIVPHTRNLLKNRPAWMTYPRIEKDTGLPVGWLLDFANSERDPASSRVVKLLEYLTGKKLQLIETAPEAKTGTE